MRLRTIMSIGALMLALPLADCTTLAQGGVNIAQSLSSSTPTQATTLDDAVKMADAVVKAVDPVVKSGRLSLAELNEMQFLRGTVRTALDNLQKANAAHQSLVFGAFNEAFKAFMAYGATKGVSV